MKGAEHQKLVEELGLALQKVGMNLLSDSEYSTKFENNVGWIIEYERGRYYPGYDLVVYPPKDKEGYTTRLLEKIFDGKIGVHRKRNFSESVAFIIDNKDWIFQSPQPYKKCYDELNKVN